MKKNKILFFLLFVLVVFLAFLFRNFYVANQNEPVEKVDLASGDLIVYSGRADFLVNKEGHYLSTFNIKNPSQEKTSFALDVEGNIFKDRQSILSAIQNMPEFYPGEPDYVKAWRLVSAHQYHADPFVASTKTHDPFLALNSVGFGYCDDVSAVLAIVWQWQGYESRQWLLEGHVVPEIWVDGRWKMFDPDYGIYYFDQKGEVASVEVLSQDPSLIHKPVNPIWPNNYSGYDVSLAAIYDGRSADNNIYFDTPVLEEYHVAIDMPANSSLDFPVKFKKPVLSYYASLTPVVGAMSMTLAEGTTGELNFPFVIIDVSGKGKVEVAGKVYDVGTTALSGFLRGDISKKTRPSDAVTKIKIVEVQDSMTIVMALNPMVTEGTKDAMVRVYQSEISPRVVVTQSNINYKPLERFKNWAYALFGKDARGISANSVLFSEVGVDSFASPVKLAEQMKALSIAGEK